MASLAYDAISIVLREHAGRLKSFREDKRKILNRTNDILHECETKAEEFMNVGRWEDVRKIRAETLERLRKFAPTEDTYVKTWFENQRTYRKRLSDDRRNETRRMKRAEYKRNEKGRQREILNQTYEILQQYIRQGVELTKAGKKEEVKRIEEQTLKRIRTIAPTEDDFDTIWFKTIDNWKQQRADDKREERRRVKRRQS